MGKELPQQEPHCSLATENQGVLSKLCPMFGLFIETKLNGGFFELPTETRMQDSSLNFIQFLIISTK